ncbi:MAG TPA: aminopeptidase, partial [Flavobacterium sp.]
MKIFFSSLLLLFIALKTTAQHTSVMAVELDHAKKTLNIQQELTFVNESEDTLSTIILNDWNNAYSSKTTPLAARFSDEFVRSFHLAKPFERGNTSNITIIDDQNRFLSWIRPPGNIDLIALELRENLTPHAKVKLKLTYVVKIASDKFTKFGYNEKSYNLKHWFLAPARYENGAFIMENNFNLDDIANGITDYNISFTVPSSLEVTSDLNTLLNTSNEVIRTYNLNGNDRNDFSLFIEPSSTFFSFKSDAVEVKNNLRDKKLDDIRKAIVVDRVVNFVNQNVGTFPHESITVSQTDYDRNPFYGLNQLPSFISPFPDEFIYEIKFLKTYLNNYLKTSLRLDPRKDNWIFDGIQIYTMMKYIDEFHPESKMMGSLSSWKLLKSFYLTNLSFNGQYSYFYMLMARKNLDQPIGDPKDTFIKFNEQIAGKYRAGLSLRYLDDYLQNDAVKSSITEFYIRNKHGQVVRSDFENILKEKANKDINWFFETIINSRDIVDYTFEKATREPDSVTFTLRNKTGTVVPIPLYGVKKDQVIFKEWIEGFKSDTTFTRARLGADKLVLNYRNEVPEYNLRNNWKSLRGFWPNNRPVKFNFMKDLEDPYYNQILYVPTLTYNLYDGLSPGLRLHNKTILDKPIIFDVNPSFSTARRSFSGSALFAINQQNREGRFYAARYSVSGNYFHYAPDAAYLKINPLVQFRFRDEDFRSNHGKAITARYVMVQRERSNIVIDSINQNYAVFDARFYNSKSEAIRDIGFMSDLQLSSKFGKAIAVLDYRKLFENNRQIDLRLYAGTFLYNNTESDFFSFALDRPTDYLFDYNYYGRSETTGLFSQQIILAEGGFKSRLDTPFANQWMTTLNAGVNIWNW